MGTHEQKNKCGNIFRTIVLALGGFYFGYYLVIYNPLGYPVLVGVLGMNKEVDSSKINTTLGLINFLFPIGALVSVILGGRLESKLGRRIILYSGEILALITLVIYMFPNIPMICIARFLSGLVTGINLESYTIIMAEILPSKLISIGNALAFFLIGLGILMGLVCQNIFSYDTLVSYWRIFLLYPGLVSIFRLCSFPCVMPTETPEYIMDTHKDLEKCKGELIKAYGTIYTLETATEMAEEAIKHRQNKAAGTPALRFREMFTKKYIKSLGAISLLCFIYQFSGVNYFSVYSTAVFDDIAGIGKEMSLATGLAQVFFCLFTPLFMTKFGRKPLVVVGCFFQGVGFLIITIGYAYKSTWVMIVGAIFFEALFCVAFGGTVSAFIGEALPAVGVGVVLAFQWACAAIHGLVIPILRPRVGDLSLLLFFMTICFVFSLVMYLVLVETKRKSLELITDEFNLYNFFSFRKGCKVPTIDTREGGHEVVVSEPDETNRGSKNTNADPRKIKISNNKVLPTLEDDPDDPPLGEEVKL